MRALRRATVVVALALAASTQPHVVALAAPSVTVEADIQYAAPDGVPLLMDAYLPSSPGPNPAVVLLHPGGFVSGDKAAMADLAQTLAGHGYAAFSVNYRLARQVPYPAPVRDAQSAVSFLRTHAGQFRIDPARIAALGGSAGGTLAAALGYEGSGSVASGSRVAAVVSWSGLLDLPAFLKDRRIQRPVLRYAGVVAPQGTEVLASGDEARTLLERASPVSHIDASDPPTLLVNAVHEFMPLDQAREARDALKRAGVAVELLSPARGHALAYTREAMPRTLAFLDRHLEAEAASSTSRSPGGGATGARPTPEPALASPLVRRSSPTGFTAIVVAGIVLALLLVAAALVRRRRGRV